MKWDSICMECFANTLLWCEYQIENKVEECDMYKEKIRKDIEYMIEKEKEKYD